MRVDAAHWQDLAFWSPGNRTVSPTSGPGGGRAWKNWGWALSKRSSRGRDLAHTKRLLLHQVDWVRVGAAILLWVLVLMVVEQCTACSSHIGDLGLGRTKGE